MIFLINNLTKTGIVIKKIAYRDYHEILHVLTEDGNIESFFYENVNKNRKSIKISIPTLLTVNYFKTTGMNKITNIDVDNYYTNIVYDITKTSYISNILELVTYCEYIPTKIYKLILKLLILINEDKIDVKLANCYFIIKFLQLEGFRFRYKKTDIDYQGYSFKDNMFVDFVSAHNQFYKINSKLIKLIYYFSIKDTEILEQIFLDDDELKVLTNLLILILNEYLGISTKTYKKIKELEELLYSFKEDNKRNE